MLGYGHTPIAGRSTSLLRNRISGSSGIEGISYPSPFFDIAHTYLPASIKSLFQWCRYYYMTNPIIFAVVNKLAEYPITELIIDTDNKGLRDKWYEYFEDDLQLRTTLIDVGLFYQCYGNTPTSLSQPFIKWLSCQKCKNEIKATEADYKFVSYKFQLKCPRCKHEGKATVVDRHLNTSKGTRIILWNPEDIDVSCNEVTGEITHYYNLPGHFKNAVEVGDKETISTSPQVFLEAVKNKKAIVLNKDNVFHLRRPSILTGRFNRGWGIPLILPVLKDTFYLQLMKKAQEAVLLERLVPLNVLSPASAPGINPYETVNLKEWREHVMAEIVKWRRDPLYMPIMPLPITHQVIGGDGRALLLNNEMRQIADIIIAGLGCPPELIWGGLSWSGSNVSLRIQENHMLRYLSSLQRFINTFIIKRTAARLDWPPVMVRFKPFKMADDMQRKAYLLQLNQAKLVSDATIREDADLNSDEEDARLKREVKKRLETIKEQQLAEAQMAGEAQVIQARYQARAQVALAREQQQMEQGTHGTAQGEPGEIEGGQPVSPAGGTMPQTNPLQSVLQRLLALTPEAREQVLARIEQQNPELANQVRTQLASSEQSGNGSAGAPLPEQLPPRRTSAQI